MNRDRDRAFQFFVGGLFLVLVLFGAGTAAVIVFGDNALGLRMINVFAAMFSALIGLGTGYLLGARSNGNGHDTSQQGNDSRPVSRQREDGPEPKLRPVD